jgi:cytochrome c oxidase cbb3-type subunit III
MKQPSLRSRPPALIRCLGALALAAWMANATPDESERAEPPATAGSVHAVGPIPGPRASNAREPASNPYEGNADARQQGRRSFVAFNCSGCHGGHAGGGMGPSLRDLDWIYGGKPTEIYNSIADGRAHGMPAWGTRLPPQVIWQLVSYIESLRTADEPEPPQ